MVGEWVGDLAFVKVEMKVENLEALQVSKLVDLLVV